MKILIVEDMAIDRLMLRSAVQHLGHECLVAASGVEGWELFGLHRPDVVISDWQMPGVDGVELCRRIRAGEWSTYTPFIFVTGLTDREHALAGMEVGADDFLTKPLDIHELRARLLVAARLKRAEARVTEHTAALETALGDLQASEERFRRQYKGFPLPTYSWLQAGDDFVLQDYNDAAEAISGDSLSDRIGRRASERLRETPLAAGRSAGMRGRTAHDPTRDPLPVSDWRAGPGGGTQFRVRAAANRHDPHRGRHRGQAGRATAQRPWQQSEKLRALGQMATGIAHDLNQSLMLVASYSDLARQALVRIRRTWPSWRTC